eukprot:jgi/Bigna1/73530/fgenesh1_pg.24_\
MCLSDRSGAIFLFLLAIDDAVFVNCHITMVCTATHKDVPGRTSFFFGTYDHGSNMRIQPSGNLEITPPTGITSTYSFTKTCTSGLVAATENVNQVTEGLKTHTDWMVWPSSAQLNLTACRNLNDDYGQPIIREDSTVACYINHPNYPDPQLEWAQPSYRSSQLPYCLGARSLALSRKMNIVVLICVFEGILRVKVTTHLDVKVTNADVEMQPGQIPPCSMELTAKRYRLSNSNKGAPVYMAASTALNKYD